MHISAGLEVHTPSSLSKLHKQVMHAALEWLESARTKPTRAAPGLCCPLCLFFLQALLPVPFNISQSLGLLLLQVLITLLQVLHCSLVNGTLLFCLLSTQNGLLLLPGCLLMQLHKITSQLACTICSDSEVAWTLAYTNFKQDSTVCILHSAVFCQMRAYTSENANQMLAGKMHMHK